MNSKHMYNHLVVTNSTAKNRWALALKTPTQRVSEGERERVVPGVGRREKLILGFRKEEWQAMEGPIGWGTQRRHVLFPPPSFSLLICAKAPALVSADENLGGDPTDQIPTREVVHRTD